MANYMKNPITGHQIQDLRGKIFGYLEPYELDTERYLQTRKVYWKCKCKCGNITSARADGVVNGTIQSCGCYNKEMIRKKLSVDYTGQHIGSLTPLQLLDKKMEGLMYGYVNVTVENDRSTFYQFGRRRGYFLWM